MFGVLGLYNFARSLKKACHQRKLTQTKCLLFNFRVIKVIPKKAIWHLAIWQNWCFGQFYHSKIEKQTRSLSQFSLVTGFFERMRENILHIFRVPDIYQTQNQNPLCSTAVEIFDKQTNF